MPPENVLLDDLEDFALEFLDHDSNWWPFLFLRPKQDERMGLGTTVPISFLYGSVLGLALDILLRLAEQPLPLDHPLVWPLTMTALMIAVLSGLAVAWNRRAARTRRRTSWSTAARPVGRVAARRSLPAKDAERDGEAEGAPDGEH